MPHFCIDEALALVASITGLRYAIPYARARFEAWRRARR